MVSYRQEVTIGHREPETITTCKMLHILLVLGQMTIVDPLTWMSGDGDVTNWWTNPEGRSNREMRVIIRDYGSSIQIRIMK